MAISNRYKFTKEEKQIYESIPIPMAIYQYLGKSLVTLLVTDALCKSMNKPRKILINQMNENLLRFVHKDDIDKIIAEIDNVVMFGEDFDVTYKAPDGERYINARGYFKTMEDGSRLAFVYYNHVDKVIEDAMYEKEYFEAPKAKFLDEHIGALAVVSQSDEELLYHNWALDNMLKPPKPFKLGMSFKEYYYPNSQINFREFFNAVDMGPVHVIEPKSKRNIELNIVSITWGKDRLAYAIYFYESSGETIKEEEVARKRKRREVFNRIMFSFRGNGIPYYEDGYVGYRVWNLTRNELVVEEAAELFEKTLGFKVAYKDFWHYAYKAATDDEGRKELFEYELEHLIALYEGGTYPRHLKINLSTPKGNYCYKLDFTMMRSPGNGDLYLKQREENITSSMVENSIIQTTVTNFYDYLLYINVNSNTARFVDKSTNRKIDNIYKYNTPAKLEGLMRHYGNRFQDIDDFRNYLVKMSGPESNYSERVELYNKKVKSIRVDFINKDKTIFFITCSDVTDIIKKEREKELELEIDIVNERRKSELLSIQTILSISNALDARDASTKQHSSRVAMYSVKIAERLGWEMDRIENLYFIALLHDIGKIGVPDHILFKPGKLNNEEYAAIKKHVEIGGNILKDVTAVEKVAEGAKFHHERYDGKGYMLGLKGEEIPIEARIICVADTVDAMSSDRPYRHAQSTEFILSELEKEKGGQFDPELAQIMIHLIEEGILEQTLDKNFYSDIINNKGLLS
ncbi:HDIG domain-containing protein [Acetitomaculum ruminis DSM 5522]|uniref:HDIG domain-containing protein n=1 Tax=Acetitomaculum ruminis DSM 5522 TaxID=1120918 RepID=A0A1I0YRY6_9FIRM|nr:HD-GYP domain-containing protein [Acetitomaculum ruminis]SFB15757.1 HDIG domain-containing protein [Acetitomaculum ruminis DSM 5522]